MVLQFVDMDIFLNTKLNIFKSDMKSMLLYLVKYTGLKH